MQRKSIIDYVHQTIGSMIQSFEINKSTEMDHWNSVLTATMFVLCITMHMVLHGALTQVMFGHDCRDTAKTRFDFQTSFK